MSTPHQLRAVSDSVLHVLERIRELEELKRAATPGTPEFVDLAAQVEDLALELLRRTEQQETLARETAAEREAGEPPPPPIDEMAAAPRALALVLADWRDAERRMVDAAPGSPEARQAAADARRLRDEYRRGHAARTVNDQGR